MVVTLTGFMLCGKSSYGAEAAMRLGWSFVDLDKEIVASSGLPSVADIFEKKGEAFFRQLETDTLKRMLEFQGNVIIALGGGVVESDYNRQLIREGSQCIWLLSSLDNSVYSPRFASMLAERPLLKGRTRNDVENLFARRKPMYRSIANQTIVTDGLTDMEVIDELVLGISSICPHS